MSAYKALVLVGAIQTLLGSSDVLSVNAVDAQSSTTLSLGTSSASAITLGKSGITTTNAGALTVAEALIASSTLAVTSTGTFTGALYANGGLDRSSSATLSIAVTNASAVSFGKGGQTTTFHGDVVVEGSLSASFSPVVAGLTTSGLGAGDLGYMSAASTVSKTKSDGTLAQATVFGVQDGNSGEMIYAGQVTVKMTTAGGAPVEGDRVWLAAHADDTNAGDGKATATAPTTGYLCELGICIDASAYSGAKTAVILFRPGQFAKLS